MTTMNTGFVLLGDSGQDTSEARGLMDEKGIPYRFELAAVPEEAPTLSTPAGRFHGLEIIKRLFSSPLAD